MYTYDPTHENCDLLTTDKASIVMEDKPLGSGGVSQAYRIWFEQSPGEWGPMRVAKKYVLASLNAKTHGSICGRL